MLRDRESGVRSLSFPGSAWERAGREALPRGPYRLEAEPPGQCVPRRSPGTRKPLTPESRFLAPDDLTRLRPRPRIVSILPGATDLIMINARIQARIAAVVSRKRSERRRARRL